MKRREGLSRPQDRRFLWSTAEESLLGDLSVVCFEDDQPPLTSRAQSKK